MDINRWERELAVTRQYPDPFGSKTGQREPGINVKESVASFHSKKEVKEGSIEELLSQMSKKSSRRLTGRS
jgi:hypothetical protein